MFMQIKIKTLKNFS